MKNILSLFFLFVFLSTNQFASGQSAEDISPLEPGDYVPDVSVKNINNEKVALHKIFSELPAVVVFYRGGWCTYCDKQLNELKEVNSQIQGKGYQLVAMSTDKPENAVKTLNDKGLDFSVYSDHEMEAADAFGISFKVSTSTVRMYKKKLGVDLQEYSGKEHNKLPVPSVFVIKDNIIRYAHSNPDYKTRLSSDSLLKVLDSVNDQDFPKYPVNNPPKKDVGSIDGIINAFYETISGPHYTNRNWMRLKTLCRKNVQFNVMVTDKKGNEYMQQGSLTDYIDYYERVFGKHNFEEKEMGRKTSKFHNIAQVFSTFHSELNVKDKNITITERGLKSFQLVFEDDRWWITNVLWTTETKDNKIPGEFLKMD